MNTPVIEGKFVQVGDAWYVQGDPARYASAASAGIVEVHNIRNGKTTVRSVVAVDALNGLQVGPKVHAARTPRVAGAKRTSKAAASKATGVPTMGDLIAGVTHAVLAALAAQGIGSAPTAPVQTTTAVKPPSAAQLAAREAFATRAREQAAARRNGATAVQVPAAHVELPVQTTSDTCVCGDGTVTHVHHGASKLADRTVRTCKQCAKNLTGEQVIEALAGGK